jgi:hypothetical protein
LSSAWCTGASGGGGAGSAGLKGITQCSPQIAYGGNGGSGTTSNITGSSVGYAGGGGGGANNNSTATAERGWGGGAQNNSFGAGDGSNSDTGVGGSATPGTGSGGGGGDWEGGGGNGASGVVVLRWLTYVPTTTAAPTTTVPATTTTVRPVATTAAPALDIVVNAPSTSAAPATTVAVGQAQIPVVSTPVITAAPKTSGSATTVPVTTTTTTVPNNAGGTVAPKAPSPPQVVAGQAAVKVGDEIEDATVERADNQLVVTAGALKAVVGGMNPDGSPMALDEAGNVRLRTGDTVRIKLAGFEPGSIMEAWLFSTPVLLGTTKVGADGTITATFTIPEDASSGSHRVVIVARTTDGEPATLAVGINVGEWEKESSLTVWLIVLPIVLAVAGALVLPATRRRRRPAD